MINILLSLLRSQSIFNDQVFELIGEALRVKAFIDPTVFFTAEEPMRIILGGEAEVCLLEFSMYVSDSPFEAHHPFTETAFFFMTRHPIRQGHLYENVVVPFEPSVWLCFLISSLMMSFTLFLFTIHYRF